MEEHIRNSFNLSVPDNVPGDVVTSVNAFLRAASRADDTGGGISHYALIVIDSSQAISMSGCMTAVMQDALSFAIAAVIQSEIAGRGGRCNCPDCQAQRNGNTKPEETSPQPPQPSRRQPSWLHKLFGRGRK
jgi:hypothetical protein